MVVYLMDYFHYIDFRCFYKLVSQSYHNSRLCGNRDILEDEDPIVFLLTELLTALTDFGEICLEYLKNG